MSVLGIVILIILIPALLVAGRILLGFFVGLLIVSVASLCLGFIWLVDHFEDKIMQPLRKTFGVK